MARRIRGLYNKDRVKPDENLMSRIDNLIEEIDSNYGMFLYRAFVRRLGEDEIPDHILKLWVSDDEDDVTVESMKDDADLCFLGFINAEELFARLDELYEAFQTELGDFDKNFIQEIFTRKEKEV